jgi:TRAP-type C4-dicarboxylate transport system substrate-binding protein
MTSSKAILNLDALAGLKIRANGPAMDKTVRTLGAVPVRVSSPELYDALTRGTVDGAFFAYQGLLGPGLQKVLKHSVAGAKLGAGAIVFGISTKSWNGLPEDVKQVMTKAGLAAQEALCKWSDAEDAKVKEKIVAQDGHTLKKLSSEEAAQWNARVSTVAEAWAKEMDSAGKKGSEMLRSFKSGPAAQ